MVSKQYNSTILQTQYSTKRRRVNKGWEFILLTRNSSGPRIQSRIAIDQPWWPSTILRIREHWTSFYSMIIYQRSSWDFELLLGSLLGQYFVKSKLSWSLTRGLGFPSNVPLNRPSTRIRPSLGIPMPVSLSSLQRCFELLVEVV